MSNISKYYQPTEPAPRLSTKELDRMSKLQLKYLEKNEVKYFIGAKQVTKEEYFSQPVEFWPTQNATNNTVLG